MISRRCLLAASGGLAAGIRRARADTMVSLLAGAPAGSPADVQACSFAPFLERHLPRTQVGVRDVVGDAGLAAYRGIADAAPDGALLGWVATPGLVARTIDRGDATLLDRLVLLGAVQQEPIVLVTPRQAAAVLPEVIRRFSTEDGPCRLARPPPAAPGISPRFGCKPPYASLPCVWRHPVRSQAALAEA